MVEFYNDRLTEREKRRDFLRARGLLNMKRMQVHVSNRHTHTWINVQPPLAHKTKVSKPALRSAGVPSLEKASS